MDPHMARQFAAMSAFNAARLPQGEMMIVNGMLRAPLAPINGAIAGGGGGGGSSGPLLGTAADTGQRRLRTQLSTSSVYTIHSYH